MRTTPPREHPFLPLLYPSHFPCAPTGKYDQCFVPEFNEGAMENAGAVTFAEAYLYREPPTQSQRLTRADTILHEMAHMWYVPSRPSLLPLASC